VGTTTLAPGETTDLDFSTSMGSGMGGVHVFEVTIPSNDPDPVEDKVQVRVDFVE
jgi:hypothetical protein